MTPPKYCIELREAGVWTSVETADTWEQACAIASMYARSRGEDAVQITGGEAINKP